MSRVSQPPPIRRCRPSSGTLHSAKWKTSQQSVVDERLVQFVTMMTTVAIVTARCRRVRIKLTFLARHQVVVRNATWFLRWILYPCIAREFDQSPISATTCARWTYGLVLRYHNVTFKVHGVIRRRQGQCDDFVIALPPAAGADCDWKRNVGAEVGWGNDV